MGIADVLATRLRQAQTEKLAPLDLVSALVSDELLRRQDRLFAPPLPPFVRPAQPTSPVPSLEGPIMDFRPLAELERRYLATALRNNSDRGLALLMDRATGFAGTAGFKGPSVRAMNAPICGAATVCGGA